MRVSLKLKEQVEGSRLEYDESGKVKSVGPPFVCLTDVSVDVSADPRVHRAQGMQWTHGSESLMQLAITKRHRFPDDLPAEFTFLFLTKSEARALGSALMGCAAEIAKQDRI